MASLEQIEVFRAGSWELVAASFNSWMLLNSSKVSAVKEIEYFSDYIPSDEMGSQSRYDYVIRFRYSTTLALLNK